LALVEVGNVRLMLVFAGGDDPSGREGGPAAVGVMHDNDVFDPEEMLRDGDRTERVHGAAAGHDNLEQRGGGSDLCALRVADDFARIYLAELSGDGRGNAHGPWVVAVNDDRP